MIIPHLYFSSKVVILINTETNEEVVDKKDEKIVTLFKLRTNMPQVRQGKPVNHEGESFCSSIIHLFKSKLFILSLILSLSIFFLSLGMLLGGESDEVSFDAVDICLEKLL